MAIMACPVDRGGGEFVADSWSFVQIKAVCETYGRTNLFSVFEAAGQNKLTIMKLNFPLQKHSSCLKGDKHTMWEPNNTLFGLCSLCEPGANIGSNPFGSESGKFRYFSCRCRYFANLRI